MEDIRETLEQLAWNFDPGRSDTFVKLSESVAALQGGVEPARIEVAAAVVAAAFRFPAAIPRVYDTLTLTWLGKPSPMATGNHRANLDATTGVEFTPTFWEAFWALFGDDRPTDALTVTSRVAALAGTLHEGFGAAAESAARAHPGAGAPHRQSPPPRLQLDTLATLPADCLGGALYRVLRANGYDAEVLDRDTLGLGALPPGLRYLNTRILQMHDVWHLVAGYETTALHEIAISAFQLAQFGHNYSAMFLATAITGGCLERPEGLPILLQITSEAWQHGCDTPSLMSIDWEQHWSASLADLRSEYGIAPFSSTLPAGLLETLAASR